MAHRASQNQPVILELVPTPHDAPPPYQEIPLPTAPRPTHSHGERCPHCQNCRHGQIPPPPPPRAPLRPPPLPVNPVERLYKRVNSVQSWRWSSAVLCLGTSAALLARFPSSTLRPLLIYLVSIVSLPPPSFCLVSYPLTRT
ncbi:hypothetical protein IMZ48_30860 [Candidatus Bathyarchaeota archaeon]|nr:hypothetical protein [Candidatus Bathyarchaeota archaeon]